MLTLLNTDARGRVTLPKSLRKSMGLISGDRLMFSRLVDGTVIMWAKTAVAAWRFGSKGRSALRLNRRHAPVSKLAA